MSSRRITRTLTRRAAFDIGSGSTKLQCTEYCLQNNIIKKTLLSEEIPILYGADYIKSTDGMISQSIQDYGLECLSKMKRKSDELGMEEYAGIATEVFRKAQNGADFLQRIKDEVGINVVVLSQEDEALVGYKSVTSFDNNIEIVWDSGGSSFQISKINEDDIDSNKNLSLDLYMDSIGTSTVHRLFVEHVRNKDIKLFTDDINPVMEEECFKIINILQQKLPPLPDWLSTNKDVVVGAACVRNSMFRVCCDVLGWEQPQVTSFTLQEATHALQTCINKTNDDLKKYANFEHADSVNAVVIKLCLLVGVMRHTGITTVHTFPCVGSCPGVISDERFWYKDV